MEKKRGRPSLSPEVLKYRQLEKKYHQQKKENARLKMESALFQRAVKFWKKVTRRVARERLADPNLTPEEKTMILEELKKTFDDNHL